MFFKTNKYCEKSVYTTTGGIIYLEASEEINCAGKLEAKGTEGFNDNDVTVGSTAGGTIFLSSPIIHIYGTFPDQFTHIYINCHDSSGLSSFITIQELVPLFNRNNTLNIK